MTNMRCYVAAEYGDYTEDEFGASSAYLKQLKLLPHQTDDIELKIMEHHKDHLYDTLFVTFSYNLLSDLAKTERG